ncbi:MAG: transglutaminase family protein [Bryobacterales bacterium]|nr:transglutaminase family protein [Bryobacterales bacterium]
MNRYHLVHVTEFVYDGLVSESYNEVRLRPIHDDRQSCLSFRLQTAPASRVSSHRDYFGNWVHQFNVLNEHRRLRVEAESVVLMHDEPPPRAPLTLDQYEARRDEVADEYYEYLVPAPFVPHLPETAALAEEAGNASDGTARGLAASLSMLVHTRFRYEKGATHVHSSIEDSLRLGAGVCQDFAHLFLSAARSRGFAARYVSGYLVTAVSNQEGIGMEEVVGGQASHAWAEMYVPGEGWIGVDPTLGAPVASRHVRVAYGRDYGDVAPVRGVYKGHAGQRLHVDVCVRPALSDDGHEQLEGSAAAPAEPVAEDAPQQQPQQQQ